MILPPFEKNNRPITTSYLLMFDIYHTDNSNIFQEKLIYIIFSVRPVGDLENIHPLGLKKSSPDSKSASPDSKAALPDSKAALPDSKAASPARKPFSKKAPAASTPAPRASLQGMT